MRFDAFPDAYTISRHGVTALGELVILGPHLAAFGRIPLRNPTLEGKTPCLFPG